MADFPFIVPTNWDMDNLLGTITSKYHLSSGQAFRPTPRPKDVVLFLINSSISSMIKRYLYFYAVTLQPQHIIPIPSLNQIINYPDKIFHALLVF